MLQNIRSFFISIYGSWVGTANSIREYWLIYGGLLALIQSPYFIISVICAIIYYCFGKSGSDIFKSIMSVIPNLLGFTIAAYAILVAFGDQEFKKLIVLHPRDKKNSYFLSINGTYCHFIIVQCFSLVYAFVLSNKDIENELLRAIAFGLFLYSLFLSIAVAMTILNISKTYQDIIREKEEREKNTSDCCPNCKCKN